MYFTSYPYSRAQSGIHPRCCPKALLGEGPGSPPDQLPTPAFGLPTGTWYNFRLDRKATALSFSHLTLIVSLFTNDYSYFCAQSRKAREE